MLIRHCDVLIVGGGTGGCAAAIAACREGMTVVMTEETRWIGGQLTSQAVPPDEHPWIEAFGCTASYRDFRTRVRRYYREHFRLSAAALGDPELNPGTGWVSKLCHMPEVGVAVLTDMLAPFVEAGLLTVLHQTAACGANVLTETDVLSSAERPIVATNVITAVPLINLIHGELTEVRAKFVLDATEMGEMLPLCGAEYRVGAESRAQTGEPNAVSGEPEPENIQGLTWVFAMQFDPEGEDIIPKPAMYDFWKAYQPTLWPGPLLGRVDLNPITNQPREIPLMSGDWLNFFRYRQIAAPSTFQDPAQTLPITIVNWPMNDYFTKPTLDLSQAALSARLSEAKNLSRSLLYWMQTELGYRSLNFAPGATGTADGFAMTPYIRESRRIEAMFTICEQHVSADANPGTDRAPSFPDSVGVGAYRIDLHPSSNGKSYIDTSSLPFEIPLKALVPVRMQNLLPACKNLGVTHITNGCYRLHPVEWNIGEAAGALAAYCVKNELTSQAVAISAEHTQRVQSALAGRGVELQWPDVQLKPL